MIYKVNENFLEQLALDLNKKYLSSGLRLGGDIEKDKIKLYTEDDHGKHSNFTTRVFKASINGNTLSGGFKISLYVLVLLLILFAFCVESIIASIISGSLMSVIFPAVIIAVELIYYFLLKRLSAENDRLIIKYLEEQAVED